MTESESCNKKKFLAAKYWIFGRISKQFLAEKNMTNIESNEYRDEYKIPLY